MTQAAPPEPPEASFSEVFAAALRGEPTSLVHDDGVVVDLPVGSWTREADDADHDLLDLCDGPSIDVGCGPGRLTVALAARGHVVLGVDVVAEAIAQALDRGAVAVLRDVFSTLPGEGRWHTALLADGNIGIGGDPVRLLRRVRELVCPGGRAVVEVAGPGTASTTSWLALESGHARSRPFRWAVVGIEDIAVVAAAAGFAVAGLHALPGRWAAVLVPSST